MSKVSFSTLPTSPASSDPSRNETKKETARKQQKEGSSSLSSKNQVEKNTRDRRNWYLYELFARQEYARCLSVIEGQLRETGGTCEYALYLKALLKRKEGKLKESCLLLQAAVLVNPLNIANRKQLGRALLLLGRLQEAIESFEVANVRLLVLSAPEDWESYYCIGVCHTLLCEYEKAVEMFSHSIRIQKNDLSFIALAEVYAKTNEVDKEESTLKKALSSSPENPTLLCMLGNHYLMKRRATAEAFDCFGRCLGVDPANPAALASVALLLQASQDYDAALSKYRQAVAERLHCPYIWNNIGASYFGKKNYYAAISCLRKAQFLRPFEWVIHYNSGLAQLSVGRYVSAYYALTSAINFHRSSMKEPLLYLCLGICLSLMDDFSSARSAYATAIDIAQKEVEQQQHGHTPKLSSSFSMDIRTKLHLCLLNEIILLLRCNMVDEARQSFDVFMESWKEVRQEDIALRYPQEAPLIVSEVTRLFQVP